MIEAAFSAALSLMDLAGTRDAVASPLLLIVEDDSFWAFAERRKDASLILTLSTGTAQHLLSIWTKAGHDDPYAMAADGLCWLLLHELMHERLNHFDLIGGMNEARVPMELVARSASPRSAAVSMDVRRCLEMQADHDALDHMLGAYDPERWQDVRRRSDAIAAVMMLIEQASPEAGTALSTHPRATTRLFQMIGHVSEMPTILAHARAAMRGASTIDAADVPSEADSRRYAQDVCLPVLEQARALAMLTGAQLAIADLESLDLFVDDLNTARYAADLEQAAFVTRGAREWAELMRINPSVLNRLGLEGIDTAHWPADTMPD